MGHQYKKKEKFCSKAFNIFATLIVAYFIGTQVIGAAGNNLKFVQISDVHFAKGEPNSSYKMLENSGELLSDAVVQVNASEGVDFVMFSGDMIDIPKRSQLMDFISIVKTLNVPWYIAFGNHDVDFDGKFTKSDFLKIVGAHNLNFTETSSYYAFKPKKGFKVIVLDTIIRERLTSNGQIDDEQLKWFEKELDEAKDDTVLIFMHVPVIEPFASAGHRLLNANEVRTIIEKHKNPIAVFQGHYHATMIKQFDNVLYISTPSLVSYPNAFRIITVTNQRKKVVFNIEFKETRLENIQKLAKIMVFASNLYAGEEKDRNGTFEIIKN